MRPFAAFLMLVSIGAVTTSAEARWTDFAPKPFENSLTVEGFASKESDENNGGTGDFGWDDTFFKEQLTVLSRGYVYHPRFLHYLLSLSGSFKQEDYAATDSAHQGFLTGTGLEYEARLHFLPEHPYNLDVFALRYEPLYMEQAATQHDTVETSHGAQFRYRGKPFFFHTGYFDNTTSTASADSNVKRLAADGQYFKSYAGGRQLSLNAVADGSWFTGASGLDGSTRDYGGGGYLDVKQARLSATAAKSTSTQDSPSSGRFDNDRFVFNELLTVYLPVHFRTEVAYRFVDNDSTTPSQGGTGSSTLSETGTELRFDLIHRLYQSLDSRYTMQRNRRESTSGDSTLTLQALDFNYGKTIPRGRILASVNASRSDSDNSGRTDIVNEPHPGTAVPGSFLLREPNVDPASFRISIPSPLPPFERIDLTEGLEYTLTTIGNRLQVDLLTLQPPFVVPGTYDVTVTYSLAYGDFELETDSYALNLSVGLLDNLLTPYVEYVQVRSDVVSGTFPGTPVDSTTKTVGLSMLDGAWRALGEYQSLDWSVSPYRTIRGEVQYIGSLRPTTRVYATATYLHRHYPVGTSSDLPDPYSDQTTTATASIQQDFRSRSLTLAAGGTYSRQDGRVQGDAYSLNGSLSFRLGKLDMSAGASAYGSNTGSYGAEAYTRLHQYYYLRIRRVFSK